ncbi:DUF349 domain-containing protein [Algoriphagus namhaensis]|uniref:DUF349 domain-containing protein n=1 Tax=Algoriphagus namhaensis TaxID=915353 RepID=A0ABV8ATB5_9BACT
MSEKSNELPEEGKVTQNSPNEDAKGKKKESTNESVEETVEEASEEIQASTVAEEQSSDSGEVEAKEEESNVSETSEATIEKAEEQDQSSSEPASEEKIDSFAEVSEESPADESPEIIEESTPVETTASTDEKVEESTAEVKPEAVAAVKEEKEESESAELVTENKEEDSEEDSEDEDDSTDEDDSEDDGVDLTSLDKTELLVLLKEKVALPTASKIDRLINEIRKAYQALAQEEKDLALAKFKEEGGLEDDFDFQPSDEDKMFDVFYFEHRRKVNTARKEAEKQKEKNLELKNEILDKLRELVDGEETTLSINAIKAIQEEWKAIGPVPNSQNRSLWANYNALMDRFYDNRSIYFELKELDRKKNLASKVGLCEKAEALKDEPDLNTAIKALNELHEEYKHFGPVPREDQEALWQRFKAASDAVYDRRKEYYDGQKEVFLKNQEEKEKLIESLKTFTEFSADRIKDWNAKTKEILEIQKTWEKIGPVPRESGKEINKAFWAGFKQFFQNKNQFFKNLDEVRAENQKHAEQLIAKAEEVMDSTDWQKTANVMIGLQKEWKTLGPTPEKTRDALYKKFKTACDTFFDNRRNANKASNSEYEANLAQKKEVCAEILKLAEAGDLQEEALTELVNKFNEIGFVPRKNMKEIQAEFKNAVDVYLEKLDTGGFDRENFLFKLNLNRIQSDPNANRTINKKEHGIRKQITELENSITLWKTNLEFFAASKTADKLRDQFDVKIQKAEDEIEKLKQKLSILREF